MVHSDSIIPDDSIIIIIIIQRAWSLCARLKERWSTWLKWLHFPQHVRKKRYNFDRLGVSVVSLQLSGKRGRFLIATTLWIRARLRKSRYVHRREERARVEFHGQWYFHFVPRVRERNWNFLVNVARDARKECLERYGVEFEECCSSLVLWVTEIGEEWSVWSIYWTIYYWRKGINFVWF